MEWNIPRSFEEKKEIFRKKLKGNWLVFLIIGTALSIPSIFSEKTITLEHLFINLFFAFLLIFIGTVIASFVEERVRIEKERIYIAYDCSRYSCKERQVLLWEDVKNIRIRQEADGKALVFTSQSGDSFSYPYPRKQIIQMKLEAFLKNKNICPVQY